MTFLDLLPKTDAFENLDVLFRFIHVLSGIVWMGLLLFLNLVNVPFQSDLPAEVRSAVNLRLLPRVLFWFRHSSMIAFLSGLVLFDIVYLEQGILKTDEGLSGRARWIMYGMTFGTIMWFNVWFLIWPAQRRILRWTKNGETRSELPALARRAFVVSRVNAWLSGPMLATMIAAGNYHSFSYGALILFSIVGVALIQIAIAVSGRVGRGIS